MEPGSKVRLFMVNGSTPTVLSTRVALPIKSLMVKESGSSRTVLRFGVYDQVKKAPVEGEEPPPEEGGEEGGAPKPKFTLAWSSHTHIVKSANLVNSVEQ